LSPDTLAKLTCPAIAGVNTVVANPEVGEVNVKVALLPGVSGID
jgi:hypothetical protein